MIVFFSIVGVVIAVVLVRWAVYFSNLKRHRGINRAEFVFYFENLANSAEVAGLVYDYFKTLTGLKKFEPHPSDTLSKTYRVVGDDLDDVLCDLVRQLGSEMPHSGILSDWFAPIDSLEEVVRFLEWIRTKQ